MDMISDMIKRGVQDVELGEEIRDLGLERLINWKHSKDLFAFRRKSIKKYPDLEVVVGKSEGGYSVKVKADSNNFYSHNIDFLERDEVVDQILQFLTEIETKYLKCKYLKLKYY